ncbi:zinc ribbon domain-containing protein [Chloroflexota bacterium]
MPEQKMNVAQQVSQLQETDLELEANDKKLNHLTSQLGESAVVIQARNRLASAQQNLVELKRQQHTTEGEIEDLTARIAPEDQKLYSGRITNTKELSNIQREVDILKAHRSQLEDKALETMENIEQTDNEVTASAKELSQFETEWQDQQKHLSVDIEQINTILANLRQKRQALSDSIDPQILTLYEKLSKQKGTAVSRVGQGICGGCRISLSTATMQQVRSGKPVQCTNCGRILYLA